MPRDGRLHPVLCWYRTRTMHVNCQGWRLQHVDGQHNGGNIHIYIYTVHECIHAFCRFYSRNDACELLALEALRELPAGTAAM